MRITMGIVLAVAACGPAPKHAAAVDGGDTPDAPTTTTTPPVDSAASGPVDVVITADNAYSFGYGDIAGVTHFTQGTRALTSGDIFNCPVGTGPEEYTVAEADAPDTAYLYIVTWDDLEVTQGELGQFRRTSGTVYTGDTRFEVCATGINYATGPDALTGPDEPTINAQISICNNGAGDATTTSKGWVNANGATTVGAAGKLAVGQANDGTEDTFPIVCQPTATTPGIDSTAQWMWYDPLDGQPGDAFHSDGTNRFKAFLIFRLAAGQIIE
jgi:hypothetical protein